MEITCHSAVVAVSFSSIEIPWNGIICKVICKVKSNACNIINSNVKRTLEYIPHRSAKCLRLKLHDLLLKLPLVPFEREWLESGLWFIFGTSTYFNVFSKSPDLQLGFQMFSLSMQKIVTVGSFTNYVYKKAYIHEKSANSCQQDKVPWTSNSNCPSFE